MTRLFIILHECADLIGALILTTLPMWLGIGFAFLVNALGLAP